MKQEQALLEWIKSLDIHSDKIVNGEELWKLLKIIDLDFFIDSQDYLKRIKEWFKEKLSMDVQVYEDFTCIYSLLLAMAVQSSSNEFIIEKMQSLPIETQLILKNIIQQVMEQALKNEKRGDNLEMKLRELQLDLDESNMKLQEKSLVIEKLSRQVQDIAKLKQENEILEEKFQEFEFLKEKYAKTELLLQKYKKKMDDLQPVKELQETISKKNNEIFRLQEELRKDGLMKKMMNNYKDQITKLETRNSGLQVENKSLSDQILELSKELGLVKESSQEQIKILNDRIIEISHQKMDQDDDVKETLDEVGKIQELNGKISDSKQEISQLSDRILVLENQLDDMTRLKIAFEQDYRKTLEINSRVQKENMELIAKLEKASDETSLSQQLEESQQMLQEKASLISDQDQTIKTISQQLQLAQEESRLKHGQVNSLLQEKESLESRLNHLRERSNTADQLLAETKASLSAQASRNGSSSDVDIKLASATQKIVQLTDQNALLHQALRKAKNHILILDKTIKDEKSLKAAHSDPNPYAEAIHSFETLLAEKQVEISRLKKDFKDLQESTKREEELMSAAWYNLCSTLQSSEIDKLAGDSPWLQLKKNDML